MNSFTACSAEDEEHLKPRLGLHGLVYGLRARSAEGHPDLERRRFRMCYRQALATLGPLISEASTQLAAHVELDMYLSSS